MLGVDPVGRVGGGAVGLGGHGPAPAQAALGFSGLGEPGGSKEGAGRSAAYLGGGRRVGRRAGGRRRAAGWPRRGGRVGLGPGFGLLDEVVQGHVQAARHGPRRLEGNRPGSGGTAATSLCCCCGGGGG